MKDKPITVCIGNYGYYNEGELRDEWISLPVTQGELDSFLSEQGLQDHEHEEIYISDYDGVPFGDGNAFDEYTSIGDLNLLAAAIQQAETWQVDRVRAAIRAGADAPDGPLGYANLVLQADDIPYAEYYWPVGTAGVSSREEAYGMSIIDDTGGIDRLVEEEGASALAGYVDTQAYGRDMLITDVDAGSLGWCWKGAEGPDTEAFDDVAEAALEAGIDLYDDDDAQQDLLGGELDGTKLDFGGITVTCRDAEDGSARERSLAELTPVEVREQLRDAIGYAPMHEADEAGARDERALLAIVDGLDDFRREAVEVYMNRDPGAGALEYACAAAQADEIDYREYDSDAMDLETRVGDTLIKEYGISDEDVGRYFDYEKYGRDAAASGATLGRDGYLYGNMPNPQAYSRDEIVLEVGEEYDVDEYASVRTVEEIASEALDRDGDAPSAGRETIERGKAAL